MSRYIGAEEVNKPFSNTGEPDFSNKMPLNNKALDQTPTLASANKKAHKKEYMKKYYQKNKIIFRENLRKWKKTNKEKANQYAKKYYSKNRTKLRLRQKEYYKRKKELKA